MSKGIPNNQITSRNTIEQSQHEDAADAKRVLLVDRSGNILEATQGADGKYRLSVSLDAAITIEGAVINVDLYSHNNPLRHENADLITDGNAKEIFTFTSVDSRSRISRMEAHASTPALFQLKLDGVVKRELWSSPMERSVAFVFDEHLPVPVGSILTVEAKVDRVIQAQYETFVSMEGYIRE